MGNKKLITTMKFTAAILPSSPLPLPVPLSRNPLLPTLMRTSESKSLSARPTKQRVEIRCRHQHLGLPTPEIRLSNKIVSNDCIQLLLIHFYLCPLPYADCTSLEPIQGRVHQCGRRAIGCASALRISIFCLRRSSLQHAWYFTVRPRFDIFRIAHICACLDWSSSEPCPAQLTYK